MAGRQAREHFDEAYYARFYRDPDVHAWALEVIPIILLTKVFGVSHVAIWWTIARSCVPAGRVKRFSHPPPMSSSVPAAAKCRSTTRRLSGRRFSSAGRCSFITLELPSKNI